MSSGLPRILILVAVAFAGIPAQILQAGSQDSIYQTSLPSVFEFLQTRYSYNDDGTGEKEVIAKIRIINEIGTRQHSEEQFEYRPLSEELHVRYVRLRHTHGDPEIIEKDVIQHANNVKDSNYDYDEHRVRIPNVNVGDTLEYDVVYVIRHSLGPGKVSIQHTFQSSEVVDERLDIDLPQELKTMVKAAPIFKSWETTNHLRKIYHWENRSPQALLVLNSPYSPSRSPDVQVSSFTTWDDVGQWYADVMKQGSKLSPEVLKRVAELTAGLSTNQTKVEAIYAFVAEKISYLSLTSFGIGGYVPHKPSETLRTGRGDCKDKIALLSAMLETIGMHPSLVLISAQRGADLDFPTPWPFDHVMAKLSIGTRQIWMDPSAEVMPFGMLPYVLRGKTGLIVSPDSKSHFEVTPTDALIPNTWSSNIDGNVTEKGTLNATVKIKASGDAALPLREAFFHAVTPSSSVIASRVKGISRADTVSSVSISDPKTSSGDFLVSFAISTPLFVRTWEKENQLTLALCNVSFALADSSSIVQFGTSQSGRYRIGPSGSYQCDTHVHFPRGLGGIVPYDKPKFSTEYASYEQKFDLQGLTLTVSRRLVVNDSELPISSENDYENFRRRIQTEESTPIAVTFTHP